MKKMEVIPLRSVGEIRLGMEREKARALLGAFRTFKNAKSEEFDQFLFCVLGYDRNACVNFICINDLQQISLILNKKEISSMTPLALAAFLQEMSNDLILESGAAGYISNRLGIGVYCEKMEVTVSDTDEETLCDRLESISITYENYWKQ